MELIRSVGATAVSECSVVTAADGISFRDLARCLAEFDARDLHDPAGFDALYKYLMHHFGSSASSAYKRIQAARACRRFPELLPAIAAGDLNLSAVCALAPVLTADNLSRVLFEAARLPREELKVYVDARGPALQRWGYWQEVWRLMLSRWIPSPAGLGKMASKPNCRLTVVPMKAERSIVMSDHWPWGKVPAADV
jgi:hypothetical protein